LSPATVISSTSSPLPATIKLATQLEVPPSPNKQ
jgi:hypothetical protein